MKTAYETDEVKGTCAKKKVVPPTYGTIIDFENEQASLSAFGSGSGTCGRLFGYTSATESTFLIDLNYLGNPALEYDGHPGYDYPFNFGTPVYASVSGCVSYKLNAAGAGAAAYHVLTIIPQSTNPSSGCESIVKGKTTFVASDTGYVVFYLHLSSYALANGTIVRCISAPQAGSTSCPRKNEAACINCPKEGTWISVTSSQPIAYVGNFDHNAWGLVGPHLHFEVDWEPNPGLNVTQIPIDPYGWRSAIADPYTGFTGKVNTWLWQTGP